MHWLGDMMEYGHGLPAPRPRQAYEYYLRAAEAKHDPSRYKLGRAHEFGTAIVGYKRDYAKTVEWLNSTEAHASAVFRYAGLIARGAGKTRDLPLARYLASIAADLNHASGRELSAILETDKISEEARLHAICRLMYVDNPKYRQDCERGK